MTPEEARTEIGYVVDRMLNNYYMYVRDEGVDEILEEREALLVALGADRKWRCVSERAYEDTSTVLYDTPPSWCGPRCGWYWVLPVGAP